MKVNPDLSLSLALSPRLPCYSGPLNWFPERCCLMDSLDPAASPSFLHTTCRQRHTERDAERHDGRGGGLSSARVTTSVARGPRGPLVQLQRYLCGAPPDPLTPGGTQISWPSFFSLISSTPGPFSTVRERWRETGWGGEEMKRCSFPRRFTLNSSDSSTTSLYLGLGQL